MEEQLETALEDCRQRLARGESITQCLAAYPAQAEQLRELLTLLSPLRELAPAPEPGYVHAARQRFHSRLVEEQSKQQAETHAPAPLRWLRRIAIPLAALAALAGSGLGLVTASADALPGSPLFPIQQAQEQVVQHLARAPEQQVRYQLSLAARRLQQVRRAEALHAPPLVINDLTASMVQATARAAMDLRAVPEPQRQRIIVQVAPLLTQEARLLAQQRDQHTGPSPAVLEQRRQQFLAAQQRLSAPAAPPSSPAVAPTRRPGATAHPTVASQIPPATRVKPATQTTLATAKPASPPTPRPSVTRRMPSFVATRTAPLRRLFGNAVPQSPPPVHTATP